MTDQGRGHTDMHDVRAMRFEASTGTSEVAGFFGSGEERLFGVTYLPARPAITGLVVCEPILSQFRAHYRIGTLTARALARDGLAVQRFQYRGMGNSDGDITRLTVASMIEDASAAADRLREVSDVQHVAYFGVNVGAYPAASLSREGNPLVLDSPPPTGRGYFRAAFRAHGIYAMKEGGEGSASRTLRDELEETGLTSLLGCRLPISIYQSLSEATLLDEVGEERRPVLMIAAGSGGELKPDMKGLAENMTVRGLDLTVEIRPKDDPFWYVANLAPENRAETGATASLIASWVKRVSADGSTNGDVT